MLLAFGLCLPLCCSESLNAPPNHLLNHLLGWAWGLLSLFWTPSHSSTNPTRRLGGGGDAVLDSFLGQGLLPPASLLCWRVHPCVCPLFPLRLTHPITALWGEGMGPEPGGEGFWFLLSSSASGSQSGCPLFSPPPSPVPFADGAPPRGDAPRIWTRPADCAEVWGQPDALPAQRQPHVPGWKHRRGLSRFQKLGAPQSSVR